ncbi:multiple sugar transport system substrate-binding protein [Paenibacillus sp. 1_12]|uniref:ABC transporter substrate-binding protein n=1 Tax=Paenibacillus sp. 1_12 TaxID=1566278 RepID=UPI0008E33499|nr:extracellular solute-binding protein [Paenibacillus sp. 1_12]SFK79006.1 multiple sugar transport system substrate-binding protein [Paenibacillus sp. 1_12]
MLNQTIRGLVVTSIIAGLLSGCAGGTGAGTDTAGAAVKSGEKVTLKFHFWYNEDQDNWKNVYKEFEKKYPNIKIESVTAGDNNSIEYLKKLDLAAASSDQIDVMMFSAPQYYSQRAAINMLEPLNSYIAKDGYKVQDEYYIDPSIGDKIYALPAKKATFFVMMNKNQLDEAGLTVPKEWTWDEFLDYSKKLTKGEGANKRYGTYFHTFPLMTQVAQINQMDNYFLYKADGKTLNIDNPLIKRSLDIRRQAEIVDKSATPYSETISQKLNYRPLYFNEKVSMILTGDYMIPEAGGTDKVPANFKTVFAPYPKVNKNDPTTTLSGGDLMSVYAKSKHKEEAYQFVRWYTTEGIQLQAKYIPSWKKADVNKTIDSLIASSKTPDKVDKESLLNVMKNSIPQKFNIPAPYSDEVDKAYVKEVERFLLGEVDADTAIKNASQKVQEVIKNNSK